jgi:hypothetical protein
MKQSHIYIIVYTINMNGDLNNKLESLKNNFYQNNKKNIIFKNEQKKKCATIINQSIDLNVLLQNTFLTFENKNIIYFQYNVFKTYATDDIVINLTNYLFQIIETLISKYGCFEMHVNLDSYTVTAHERYKNMYITFFDLCKSNNMVFSDKLSILNVYNTPSVIHSLRAFFAQFIDKNAVSKIHMYDKKNSVDHFNILLNSTK